MRCFLFQIKRIVFALISFCLQTRCSNFFRVVPSHEEFVEEPLKEIVPKVSEERLVENLLESLQNWSSSSSFLSCFFHLEDFITQLAVLILVIRVKPINKFRKVLMCVVCDLLRILHISVKTLTGNVNPSVQEGYDLLIGLGIVQFLDKGFVFICFRE